MSGKFKFQYLFHTSGFSDLEAYISFLPKRIKIVTVIGVQFSERSVHYAGQMFKVYELKLKLTDILVLISIHVFNRAAQRKQTLSRE